MLAAAKAVVVVKLPAKAPPVRLGVGCQPAKVWLRPFCTRVGVWCVADGKPGTALSTWVANGLVVALCNAAPVPFGTSVTCVSQAA